MKKISKKILALLLALVMVFGVVPNIFPAAEEVKASETTNTVDEFAGYDVHYDFENADLSQMNLTSTQLSNSAPYEAIEGQVDKPIAEHWFTGTSGYKTSTSIKNNGMKPKNDNGTANVKQSMIPVMSGVEDFEMNVDMYASTGFGVAIGSKNVFPNGGTNTGIRVYFNNGWIRLVGTFNASSLRVSGTAYTTKWITSGQSLDFHPSATSFTNMYTNRQKETLNIRVHDDMLVLWLDSSNTVLSIELTDTSVMDTVSLIGNFYNGGGGFSSVDVKKYDQMYDFEGADLSKLPLTSTQLSNDSPYGVLEGQVDKPLGDHWFIGTSGYTTSTNIKNNGLKPKNNNTTANLKYSFIPVISGVKDFEMSLDMYASSDFGIAIGSKNVMPGAGTNTGAKIYFAGGYMRLVGTFDASSLKVTGTSYSYGWNTSGKDLNFNPKSTTTGTNIYTNRQLETLNIKVQGNLLTLSMDSCDTVLSIRLTDTSSMNTVSLYGRYYNGGGGFKSVGLRRSKTQYDFEKADLSLIDLKSTQLNNSSPYNVLEGQEDKSLADHWFTGTSGYTTSTNIKNNALKPKNNNSEANLKYSMIPIMSGAEDFELNLDIYASSDFGVTIGSKNVMPGAGTNTGFKIYFAGGYMRLVGTFDASSLNVTGTSYSWGWNTSGKDLNFNPKYTTTGTNIYTNRQLETLNIRVQENVLTLWLDSSDTVLTIGLTDTSAMDTVSLFGRYYNGGGGFKGFKINPLQPAGGTKFDDLDLSTLTGWKSMIYDTAEKESVVADAITDQWFTGKTNYPSTENGWNAGWNSFKNSGLKPLAVNPSNQVTVLTSPDTYENFDSSFTYYQNSMAYGMVFGERGIYPQEVVDPAVRVYIQSTEYGKFLRVVGAVDSNSAVNTGTVEGEITSHRDYVEMKLSNLGYAPAAASATATVTINVKVENSQVTVSVEGIDAAMTVNLTGNYVYGPISLYATGCAHGGFKKLNVETLEDSTPVESTDVGFNVKVQGDYTAVTMSSEQAYSVINGDVKFDTSLYEYVVATFGTRSVMVNDNKFFTPEEDTLPIDILYNGDEEDKVVTLYFKNLSSTYDYSNLAFEDLQVIVSGGDEVATVNQSITVVDDFTGDKKVNIVDLVKGKKDGETLTTLRKSLVGLADESVSPLIGKSLLFLGDSIAKGAGDQYWMSWAARIGREGVLYDNQGQSGWTLTNTATSGQGQIATQLDKATRDEYDFVLLEGGVNDVRIFNGENKAGIKWGEIDYDLNNTTYDTSTIVGAMQDLIVKTQQKFGNAKILYVINSYFGIEGENVTNYRALVKELCELHGIEYIDLSDLETYPDLWVLTPEYENMQLEYLPDLLHPNAASYELTTPYVVEKMEEMLLQDK